MKRILILSTALTLLATACAERGAGSLGPIGNGNTPTESPSVVAPTDPPAGSPSPQPTEETMTFEVWYAHGPGPWLFVTERTEPFAPAIGGAALNALFAGPSELERGAGVSSAIPQGTRLLGLSIEDGLATADLSAEYESGGGSASMLMRLAQLTYTLTQFDTIDEVLFTLEGQPVGEFFSGEGIVIEDPMTRRDFADLLAPIVVAGPVVGQRVTSPITVSGTANVFEATVSISVLDAEGNEIARAFTTATCGTGCRGDYSEAVEYDVDRTQPGTVRVYESSAEDGRPINVVDVPVTLVA
jgi:hypothetical protein